MEVKRTVSWVLIGISLFCLASSQQATTDTTSVPTNTGQSVNRAGSFAFKVTSISTGNLGSSAGQAASSGSSQSTPAYSVNPPYKALGVETANAGINNAEPSLAPSQDSLLYMLPLLRSLRKKSSGGEGTEGTEAGAGGGKGHTPSVKGATAENSQEQQTGVSGGKNRFLKMLMSLMAVRNQGTISLSQLLGNKLQKKKAGDSQDKGPAEKMISLQDLMDNMRRNRAGLNGNANILFGQSAAGTAEDGANSQMPVSGVGAGDPLLGIPLAAGNQGFGGLDMNALLDGLFTRNAQGGEMGGGMFPAAIEDSQEVEPLGMHNQRNMMEKLIGLMGLTGQQNDLFGQLFFDQTNGPQVQPDGQMVSPSGADVPFAETMLGQGQVQRGMDGITQTGLGGFGDPFLQGKGQFGEGNMFGMSNMGWLETAMKVKALRGMKRGMQNQDSMEAPPTGLFGTTAEAATGEGVAGGQKSGAEGGGEGSPMQDRKKRLRKLMFLLALQNSLQGDALSQSGDAMTGMNGTQQFGLQTNATGGSSNSGLMTGTGQFSSALNGGGGFTLGNFRRQWFAKLLRDRMTRNQGEEGGAGSEGGAAGGEGARGGFLFGRQSGGEGQEGNQRGFLGMFGRQSGGEGGDGGAAGGEGTRRGFLFGRQSGGEGGEGASGKEGARNGFLGMFGRQSGGEGQEGAQRGFLGMFGRQSGGEGGEGASGREGTRRGFMGLFGRQSDTGGEGAMDGGDGGMAGREGGASGGEGSMRSNFFRMFGGRGSMSGRFGMSAFSRQSGTEGGAEGGSDGEATGSMANGACPRFPYTLKDNTVMFPYVGGNCKLTVTLNFPDVGVGESQGISGVRAEEVSQMTPIQSEDGQAGTCPTWRMWRVGKYATFIETVPGRCQIVIYAARSNRRGMNVDQVRINFVNSLGGRSRGSGDFGQWKREGFKRLTSNQSGMSSTQGQSPVDMTTTPQSDQMARTTPSLPSQPAIRFQPPQTPR